MMRAPPSNHNLRYVSVTLDHPFTVVAGLIPAIRVDARHQAHKAGHAGLNFGAKSSETVRTILQPNAAAR
jgi:hypothetical protein